MKIKMLITNRKGTALLVAMLVMGVLIAVSLALSSLIIRELNITRGVLDSSKAYYAAESGIEMALYNINNKLEGWETPQKKFVPFKLDEDLNTVGEYRVDNTCKAYPCFDDNEYNIQTIDEESLKVYYDVLDLNESITVPLFVVDDAGVEHSVGNFTVEFFAPFDPNRDLKVEPILDKLSGWDILRWKVFGIPKTGELKRTESISDFTALSVYNLGEDLDETHATNAKVPSWFGSISCSDDSASDRYTEAIFCGTVVGNISKTEIIYDRDMISPIYAGVCDNRSAREHYVYYGDEKVDVVVPCYPIKDFLDQHRLNYLTLTNLMNPRVFKENLTNQEKEALSKLYFRVELFEDPSLPETSNQTVREYANITSNGYSGDSKQSINVKMKRGTFMPVFNFSLYSTYKESGSNYYGEE